MYPNIKQNPDKKHTIRKAMEESKFYRESIEQIPDPEEESPEYDSMDYLTQERRTAKRLASDDIHDYLV